MHSDPKPMTFQEDIYDKVIKLVPQDRETKILDVGAGQGFFSKKLKQLGCQVEACDFSKDQFKCQDIPFIQANLNQQIPCESNKYDCIVCIEVIEHIENHFFFVNELFRVVKPNGLVIITTPNVLSFTSRWHFFLYGFTDCSPTPLNPELPDYFMQHINPISLPELIFQIERSGGKLEKLATNRFRRSSLLPMILLYPFISIALRMKLLRKKHIEQYDLHRRHIHWLLKPANLLGRITIVRARKLS